MTADRKSAACRHGDAPNTRTSPAQSYEEVLPLLGAYVQNAAVSLLSSEIRLYDILLRLQRVESRVSNAIEVCRKSEPGRKGRQIERERRRLGHQLHTGVGQLLATIPLQTAIIRRHAAPLSEETEAALRRIDSLAHQAHEEVRGLSRRLYAPDWQRLSLHAALQQLWKNSGISQELKTSIIAPPLPIEPSPAAKTLLYRTAQEGLSNLVRHAPASRASLTLACANGWITLTITDDGIGFDPAQLFGGKSNTTSGIGIRALREEAAELGGRLTIRSGPRGTTLQLLMPVEASAAK